VPELTLTRKLGILARVAAQQAGRSRTLAAVTRAGEATARSFGRVLHQLWLEVTGFVFLAMAGIGGIALSREYVKFAAGRQGPGRMLIAVAFCLTFGYFGVNSFWRVRKKS
jgi:hypothetical protein